MKKIRIALLCYTYEESDEQNKEKVSRLLKKVEDADFALPSGKIIKEETRRELSVHTFPPLDALIKRERSRMNWERPFDRNIKFNSDQND